MSRKSRRKTRSKKGPVPRQGSSPAASRSNLSLFAGIGGLVLVGWLIGGWGPLSWPVVAFFSAALFGGGFSPRLRSITDQHKTLAHQTDLSDVWNGTGNVPLAEMAALFLLLLWIAFLWMGMDRFPDPALVSSAAAGLWAAVGMVLRSAWVVWRRGSGWVPPDPKVVSAAASALKSEGRDRSRWTTVLVGLVALQAAAGQVLMGGAFGVELISPAADRELGSLLVAAAGCEVLCLLVSYRLHPVADRVAGMQALLRSSSKGEGGRMADGKE